MFTSLLDNFPGLHRHQAQDVKMGHGHLHHHQQQKRDLGENADEIMYEFGQSSGGKLQRGKRHCWQLLIHVNAEAILSQMLHCHSRLTNPNRS